jgi:hypothetical protein
MLRSPAGGRPAATDLFCFAKKGKPKKATALPLPLRGSRLCKSKNGKCPQLATLRQGHFFFHFLPCTNGSGRADGGSKARARLQVKKIVPQLMWLHLLQYHRKHEFL